MPKRTAQHLTEALVEAAQPAAKPYDIRDAGLPGLVLRVLKSGAKSWNVVYEVDGRRTRKMIGKHPHLSVKAARAKAKKPLAMAEEGLDPFGDERSARSVLLGKYLDGPYKEYARAHILSHADLLPRLKRNWGHLANRSMAEINELDVKRWRKSKMAEANPVSFETLERELTYLKAMLSTAAKEHKLIASHQLQGYSLKRDNTQMGTDQGSGPPRYLAAHEETALRKALAVRDSELREARMRMRQWQKKRRKAVSPAIGPEEYPDHITPIVLLALNTGLRRGDLFSLEWRHIDLGARKLRKVINKTRRKNPKLKSADLPLSHEATEVLAQWRRQSAGDGLVFPSPATGGKLTNIKKAWGAVIEAASVKDFRFHDLRHTFASKLVMSGVDINTVRELMTHSKIEMTLVYAHLSPDHKRNAIEKAFGQALPNEH